MFAKRHAQVYAHTFQFLNLTVTRGSHDYEVLATSFFLASVDEGECSALSNTAWSSHRQRKLSVLQLSWIGVASRRRKFEQNFFSGWDLNPRPFD